MALNRKVIEIVHYSCGFAQSDQANPTYFFPLCCQENVSPKKQGFPFWIRIKNDPSRLLRYRDSIYASDLLVCAVACFDLGKKLSLLDVAGGSGVYACAISRRYRHLNAAVLEIPSVDRAAQRSIASKGMSARVNVVVGDMYKDIPKEYDGHIFSHVFHDRDIDSVRKLAENTFSSLAPGGSIVVCDAHLNEDKSGPLAVAEYSCLLMYSTEGRCYSTKEIDEILQEVGFIGIAVTEVAAERTMIIGNKI